jgi:hypothetical protein
MIGYVYCPYRGNRGTRSSGEANFLLLSYPGRPWGNTGHGLLRRGDKGTQTDSAARPRTSGEARPDVPGGRSVLGEGVRTALRQLCRKRSRRRRSGRSGHRAEPRRSGLSPCTIHRMAASIAGRLGVAPRASAPTPRPIRGTDKDGGYFCTLWGAQLSTLFGLRLRAGFSCCYPGSSQADWAWRGSWRPPPEGVRLARAARRSRGLAR